MDRLDIIRASAGSGKTHFLTGFFLKILMRERTDYFKQILAVTFTNKATAEMKRRILQELNRLADNLPSDYMQLLIQSSHLTETAIRKKSATLLQTILHDYSWFSIETIDSFFQRVIRGFTHEIGVPGNYSIEIETKPILQFAVDTFLDSLEDKKDILTWLVHYTEDKIQQAKAWDIRHGLITLGNEIFKEKFAEHAIDLNRTISDKQKLMHFRNELVRTKSIFESHLADLGNKGIGIIDSNGFTHDDFYQKTNGAKKFFERFASLELTNTSGVPYPRTPTYMKLLESAENWPSTSTNRKNEVMAVASEYLQPLLMEAFGFLDKNYATYKSALEILRNIYAVGILTELSGKIREYRIEKNVFILSDSSMLINKIINQNDAPFIYEKMGNRYGHFLIDEFQDTSALQWYNFKPLISNSLSQGNQNLLVGDVKQSIYRWRNSNWETLAYRISDEYPADILHFEELRKNWRSNEKIVLFNNALFPLAVKKLKVQLDDMLSGSLNQQTNTQLLETIFNDIQQEFPRKSEHKGSVYVKFFSLKDSRLDEYYYQEELVNRINALLQKGYSLNDIAILVRHKKEGQTIANLLIKLNAENRFKSELHVISEESLFLDASNAVSLIIAAFQYLNNPSDPITRARLLSSFEQHQLNLQEITAECGLELNGQSLTVSKLHEILPPDFIDKTEELIALPLYDLTERLIFIFKMQNVFSEVPFVHAMLDVVHDYTAANPGNIGKFLEFWEEEGSSKTVPAGESQNAIRILTIHKSKGLEFKGVIIPFCSWKLDQKANSIIWTETSDTTFNYLPVVPLNYNKGLMDTQFASIYYSELFKSYVDNLNLLYVALTRAIDSLIVFPVFNDSENNQGKIITVGDLLYDSIVKHDNSDFRDFDPQKNSYESNSEEDHDGSVDKNARADNYFTVGSGTPMMDKIFFRTRGINYFENLEISTLHGSVRGSVLHDILASIETHTDLSKSVRQAVLEGMISASEGEELRNHILLCFQQSSVFSWFNGSGNVLTEKDIILPGGRVKRPDRVVLFPDGIHVIDYKFGSEENREGHILQVQEYTGYIRKMGHTHVEGFLWYIDMNEVISV
jgi:ATP-dependent helicase/nuclease subunit A